VLIPTPRRILVARDPVDFRKGIAGLAAVCEVRLGEAPLDGTITPAELAALMEGIDLAKAHRRKRWNPREGAGKADRAG